MFEIITYVLSWETGANPVRLRRCDGVRIFLALYKQPLGNREGGKLRSIPEPEYLHAKAHFGLFARICVKQMK